ncbi:MAG: hypothetical protein MHMPM18_002236 [Marteilia pararefringens]
MRNLSEILDHHFSASLNNLVYTEAQHISFVDLRHLCIEVGAMDLLQFIYDDSGFEISSIDIKTSGNYEHIF